MSLKIEHVKQVAMVILPVLKDISFNVQPGENGWVDWFEWKRKKSTTIKHIIRFGLNQRKGKIEINHYP